MPKFKSTSWITAAQKLAILSLLPLNHTQKHTHNNTKISYASRAAWAPMSLWWISLFICITVIKGLHYKQRCSKRHYTSSAQTLDKQLVPWCCSLTITELLQLLHSNNLHHLDIWSLSNRATVDSMFFFRTGWFCHVGFDEWNKFILDLNCPAVSGQLMTKNAQHSKAFQPVMV